MPSATSVTARCEFCHDTGWRPRHPLDRRSRVVKCECIKEKRKPYGDGVPLEFRAACLSNYRTMAGNKAAVVAARTFIEAHRGDLVLIGPVGSGKTRLACSVLNEHYRESGSGLFVRVPRLLLELQLMFGSNKSSDDGSDERTYCERLFSASLLVLDDLGVEKASDYSTRTLYTVYEERCDRGLRTIWTSNLGLARDPKFSANDPNRPPTLGEFFGDDRLPSRLAGRALIAFLQCDDQRLAAKKREVGVSANQRAVDSPGGYQ